MRFESLEEAQAYLDHWETRWADTRIHGTTKRQVAAMFAEEKPSLLPLPIEPFRYYQYGERTVHLDGCVEVEAAYYSAPPGWIGRQSSAVGCSARPPAGPADRPAAARAPAPDGGRHRIKDEDRPKQTPLTTLQLLARADKAGSQIGELCRGIHRNEGETRHAPHSGRAVAGQEVRRAPRSTMPAPPPWKWACDEYRFVRRYLERHPQLLSLRQVDPLIRQLTQYRDFIDNKTKENK